MYIFVLKVSAPLKRFLKYESKEFPHASKHLLRMHRDGLNIRINISLQVNLPHSLEPFKRLHLLAKEGEDAARNSNQTTVHILSRLPVQMSPQ